MIDKVNDDDEWTDDDSDATGVRDAASFDGGDGAKSSGPHGALKALANYGIDFIGEDEDALAFTPHPRILKYLAARRPHPRAFRTRIAGDQLDMLEKQLRNALTHTKKRTGVAVPSIGYAEFPLMPIGTLPYRQTWRQLLQMSSDGNPSQCEHRADFESPPLISGRRDAGNVIQFTPIHLVGKDACLEISSPSLACHVLCNYEAITPRFVAAVKVFFDQDMTVDDIERMAEPLLNSLLYELDVRNGVRLRTEQWATERGRRHGDLSRAGGRIVRFPATRIQPEVAVLFGFAGSATANPPLAYLTYYQVLERYFPLAGSRAAIRNLRLELADPQFDRMQDLHLMRLITVGKNVATSSEAELLKILLGDFVRQDKLVAFFEEGDWKKHFGKSGPIQGVADSVNPKNKSVPLSSQVADRVYVIRNRIVHTKDDPKYDDVPALLPQSDEAAALWPDIALMRLLCEEVIISAQATS